MRKTQIIIFCFLFVSCEFDFQFDKKITVDEFLTEELNHLIGMMLMSIQFLKIVWKSIM